MSHGPDVDLAIVGSGFGGSILAMIARRLGYRVMLLERGRHPRFAIGESASPLAGVLIEQLADRYDLPRVRPLSAFGTWQRTYPDVVCGLKRGFTYFKHETGRAYQADAGSDRISCSWRQARTTSCPTRTGCAATSISFLVREAIALGVDYLDEVDARRQSSGSRSGDRAADEERDRRRSFRVRARLRRGCAAAARISQPGARHRRARLRRLSADAGIVSRTSPTSPDATTMPDFESRTPSPGSRPDPGPVSDRRCRAASRVRRRMDVGAAIRQWRDQCRHRGRQSRSPMELRLADGAPAWERFLARYPSIAAQFADARPIREFTWMPRVAYRAAAGRRRAMGDAAVGGGVHRSVVLDRDSADAAGHRTAREAIATAGLKTRGLRPALYGDVTLAEADHTARFIAGMLRGVSATSMPSRRTRCSTSPPRASARCSGASRLSAPLAASSARQMSRTYLRCASCHRPTILPSRTSLPASPTRPRQSTSPASVIRRSATGIRSISRTRFAPPASSD